MDGNSEALTSFLGISEFYDDRKCAVTCTIDDAQDSSEWGGLDKYLQASKTFSDAQVWWTAGLITSDCHDWATYQTGINMGYVEIASHSQTHPNYDYEWIDKYDEEIGGSKQVIIDNLDLPFKKGTKEYVWCWLEPQGYSDETVQEKLGEYKYLVSRNANNTCSWPNYTLSSTTWAQWDSINMHYSRADPSISLDWDNLGLLNSLFDETYRKGGIYHVRGHVGKVGWLPGEKGYAHIQYLKGHADVWYVSFGSMYVYHHLQRTITVKQND
jgi:hypothetical protein